MNISKVIIYLSIKKCELVILYMPHIIKDNLNNKSSKNINYYDNI